VAQAGCTEERRGSEFSGAMMNCGVRMSPVVAVWRVARCVASSGHSWSRSCEEVRSVPRGHGSAVTMGGGSVGARLQNTRQIARVSAQSTSWRRLGKVKDGVERGS